MSDDLQRLEAAKLAVIRAARICRGLQKSRADTPPIIKSDRSPVTIADFASQAVIAMTLEDRLGKTPLVAEESTATIQEAIAAGRPELEAKIVEAVRTEVPGATWDEILHAIDLGTADPPRDNVHGFWTLDPIDGTKGFVRGGQYSIALAWIQNGSPIVGVVGCPNLSSDQSLPLDEVDPSGTLYYAIATEGLCEVPADNETARPLVIRRLEPQENEPVRMVESIELSHTSHNDSERVLEHLGEPAEPVRLDGQTKYVVVARGQADIYLRLPTRRGYVERIWDHAAGALIAAESGCAVTDIAGNPLDFSHGRGLEQNRGILVAPARLHGKALGAIRDLQLEQP